MLRRLWTIKLPATANADRIAAAAPSKTDKPGPDVHGSPWPCSRLRLRSHVARRRTRSPAVNTPSRRRARTCERSDFVGRLHNALCRSQRMPICRVELTGRALLIEILRRMPMCCIELTRRAVLIEPLCEFGRPASDRNSTACAILQDNEVAIPRGSINCLAHENTTLDVSRRRSTSWLLASSSLSWPFTASARRSSISVELRKWSCLALLSQ